eukprot:4547300-Pyramimonas_sp.AAC.1
MVAPTQRRWSPGPRDCEPELTTQRRSVHDRASGPLELLDRYRSDWGGHWNELDPRRALARLG